MRSIGHSRLWSGVGQRAGVCYPTADDWLSRSLSPHLATPGLIGVESDYSSECTIRDAWFVDWLLDLSLDHYCHSMNGTGAFL